MRASTLHYLLLGLSAIGAFAQSDFSCSPSKPCKIGCCSNTGVCGLGPTFCGAGNCTSSCNYKSECDPGWGAEWSNATKCPLNVCCSKYGFCGTSSDFCGGESVKRPSCSGSSASHLTVGYYEGWATGRACDGLSPEDIPLGAYTHLNYAFAFIDPQSFAIAPMSPGDVAMYPRFTGLKQRNPLLRTYIAIGGWTMNDPDQPTRSTFSDLAASTDAQQKFFASLIQFMSNYGFDGVDIDWEYPVAEERFGKPDDYKNYVTLLQNMRQALKAADSNYGLTITIPSSYWYLKGFDISAIAKTIDWFNLMSYDLHGLWDGNSPWIGPVLGSHTNLTEIEQALDLLWRNNIDPAQVVLGLGFYGRSFTLANPSCNKPGCPFSAGGKPGPCTASAGTLSYSEIQGVIAAGATPELDKAAAVKMLTWNNDQWVSYDDQETMRMKLDYANNLCLGGTMVWAVSTDTSNGDAIGSINRAQQDIVGVPSMASALIAGGCSWTGCGGSCKKLRRRAISTGLHGGFLGDVLEFFGHAVAGAVSAVVTLFGFVGSGFDPIQTSMIAHDSYGWLDLGLTKGVDVVTQSCVDNVKEFCCPPQDPPVCHWDGTAPFCSSECSGVDTTMIRDSSGDGHRCWTGDKSLCCRPEENQGEDSSDNTCVISDGNWPLSGEKDEDGSWFEADPEPQACSNEKDELRRRDANTTLTPWNLWLDNVDLDHHFAHLEKRGRVRRFPLCDRSRARTNRLRSRRYGTVRDLAGQGMPYDRPRNQQSCPLTDIESSSTPAPGTESVVEHVTELNTVTEHAQAMVDGIAPGGATLNAGRVDFDRVFGAGGYFESPWSAYGVPLSETPMDTIYEALGSTTNTANFRILERKLNGMKSLVWRRVKNLIAKDKWDKMSHQQRKAALNSIVYVFDYLNTDTAQAALQSAHDGMEQTWRDFQSMLSAKGINYDFHAAYIDIYRAQFDHMVSNAEDFLTSHIADEMLYWRSTEARTTHGAGPSRRRQNEYVALQNAVAPPNPQDSRVKVKFRAKL